MPFGDETGPDGAGRMTGRGLGFCAGFDSPGFTRGIPRGARGSDRGFGQGFGRGRGRGFGRGFGRANARFGFGRRFEAIRQDVPQQNVRKDPYALTKEQEIADLKAEKQMIEKELEEIKKRLSDIEHKE